MWNLTAQQWILLFVGAVFLVAILHGYLYSRRLRLRRVQEEFVRELRKYERNGWIE
jgi:hypothetical protein